MVFKSFKVVSRLVIGGILALIVTIPDVAQAAPDVFPGETLVFATATDGTESCRKGSSSNPCGRLRDTEARATPAENKVFARTTNRIANPGFPLYATASVSNDFVIPGPPDDLVDVQISVRYDFSGTFLAASEYTLENVLQLRIQDRGRGEIVASHSLAQMQRQGDQGLTDINFAEERADLVGEVAHFAVKLRRGGLYRLHFELQSSAVTFANANVRGNGTATFHWISVSVDEDEAEQLTGHDQAIKAELALLQADHDQLKADHAEIKSQLGGIRDDIAEIKTLLLTPPGRRPGFPEDGVPPPGQQSAAPAEDAPSPVKRNLRRRRFN